MCLQVLGVCCLKCTAYDVPWQEDLIRGHQAWERGRGPGRDAEQEAQEQDDDEPDVQIPPSRALVPEILLPTREQNRRAEQARRRLAESQQAVESNTRIAPSETGHSGADAGIIPAETVKKEHVEGLPLATLPTTVVGSRDTR